MDWQPIETAPCIGQKRLLFKLANGKFVVGYRHAGSRSVRPEFLRDSYLATHWMPLPPPPSKDTEQ